MRLLRYGPAGGEKPGMVDAEGALCDLSAQVHDIDASAISPEGLARLAALDPGTLPRVEGTPRIGCPIARVPNFVCIGLNYADHAAETNSPLPDQPIVFMKHTASIAGPYDPVRLPRGSTRSDWEVELGVVIGTRAAYVDQADAMDHIAGYTICNDISERRVQGKGGGGQWVKGKSPETFGPIGPWLVTKDEIADPHALALWLEVDGHRYQNSSTAQLIFKLPELIAHLSAHMTLLPGDVISTGTPPGVGMGVKPEPVFLKPGNVMRLGIEGLGEQRQEVLAGD